MSRPDDVLDALRSDIERIRVDSRWAFNNGWWPNGADPDRVAGVNPQDVIGRDDTPLSELVRREIGVGDPLSRRAYLDTACLVTFIDLRLVATLAALGETNQPPFLVVNTTSTLNDRLRALSMSAARLELVAEVWDAAPRPWQRRARTPLADSRVSPPSARAAAHRAVVFLSSALARGDTQGLATGEPMCFVCQIRPVAERAGGRCWTCATYRVRNRGVERPRSLDHDELAAPIAAAARRRARGDGFGAS